MKTDARTATILLGMLLGCGAAPAGEGAGFATKPSAAKAGDKVAISFAVAAPTDVEVAVLSADGKVVRHLAAGILGGKKPPPEPLKAGLAQDLIWDGKDDLGKQVYGGPLAAAKPSGEAGFKVRVRAGMSVKFGRIIGTSPYTGVFSFNVPRDSLAVDADGTLYVKLASIVPDRHDLIPWQLRRFDRNGKYRKTVLPYPPSTDPARASGFSLTDAGDGLLTPGQQGNEFLDKALLDFGNNIHSRVVDGCVVFIDTAGAKLTLFKVDGSNAVRTVDMRTAPDKLRWPEWLAPQLAFSPDGKYAYYSNVAGVRSSVKKPSDIDPKFPQGRIYRQDLTKPGAALEKFFDLELPDYGQKPHWLPSQFDGKTAAAGIDTDAKGSLLVCDLVNQEMVEVNPEGKKLSATKVPWPDKVLVSRKTGACYVVSRELKGNYGRHPGELLKITGRGAEAKVVARLPLKSQLGHSLALDESGDVPVLWLGGSGQNAGPSNLVRVEDRGASFSPAGDSILNPSKDDVSFVCYGDVDTEAELVYVTAGNGAVWRYNGETGEGGLFPVQAADLAVGPGGTIYAWADKGNYKGPVVRYGRDGKPAPLAATGKHTYGAVYGRAGRGVNAPGIAVDNRGWVYATCGFNDCHVRAFDADGRLVDHERKGVISGNETLDGKGRGEAIPAIISYVLDMGGSLRVDNAYNLYVLEIGLPKDFVPPKGFEKDPRYTKAVGTIYKFTSKGGEFKKAERPPFEAVGAVQAYPGCGTISGGAGGGSCHCQRPRFGLDGYGRLYIPNGVTYKVSVRDNADNEIVNFGGYGNWDAQGPQSAEPRPEIPLGWPMFAGPSDGCIYVGDGLNHRVVRVDKKFAAEESCEIR